MDKGFIKLHRSLLSHTIWVNSTLEQRLILINLLFMANYRPNKWEFGGEVYELQPGQFVTSIKSIVERCECENITTQKVRTALERFEKLDFLTTKTTNKNTLVTIVNWAKYQIETVDNNKQFNNQITNEQQTDNKQITNEQQTDNKRITTIEEYKERKEGKESKKVKNNIYSSEQGQQGKPKKLTKIKYAEFVSMTEAEYLKLVEAHGEDKAKRMIELLDNYKGANSKTYKSDYRAILNWVVEKVNKEYNSNGGYTYGHNRGNNSQQGSELPGGFVPSTGFRTE